jgi:hypothetical protein
MADMDQIVQGPGERHMIYGGTRTGKSSLMDWSIRHIQKTRPDAMILIADTKPRFRASHVIDPRFSSRRKSTVEAKTYADWTAGPTLPNSVRVELGSTHPFRGLWDVKEHPGEVAIMQSDEPSDWKTMNELMHEFVHAQKSGRERLIVVDEGLDFYQRNTLGIDSRKDVILRTARAGGERNIGLMLGAHRPHGIPPLLNTLSSRVSLFHLRYTGDMKYLYDMGVNPELGPPPGNYVFHQFTVEPGGTVSAPLTATMKYPDSYLKQLSAT